MTTHILGIVERTEYACTRQEVVDGMLVATACIAEQTGDNFANAEIFMSLGAGYLAKGMQAVRGNLSEKAESQVALMANTWALAGQPSAILASAAVQWAVEGLVAEHGIAAACERLQRAADELIKCGKFNRKHLI